MFQFTCLVVVCLAASVICNQEDDFTNIKLSCHRSSYMVPIEKHETGYIYLGAGHENTTARSLAECVTFCTRRGDCESVNFWKNERVCQMNSGVVDDLSLFTAWNGGVYRQLAATHTDSLGGCHGNPCKNGATCHEICDGSARHYECTCTVSHEGYDCETAKCYSPSVPANAYITASYSWPVASGTQIQILCNTWYNIAGSSTVTCTAGSWSATPSCSICSGSAVGCQSYAIPNSQITASSNYDGNHMSYQGRLYYQSSGSWSWCSRYNSVGQWLQVDIGSARMVTQVATQGRGDSDQWVTSYKIYHYYHGGSWTYVREDNGSDKTFSGNWNRNTVVYHALGSKSFVAQFVRFVVQGWYNHMSMRVEVYACTG